MFQGNIWYIDMGCRFQSANLAIEDEPFDSTCSTEDGKNEGNSKCYISFSKWSRSCFSLKHPDPENAFWHRTAKGEHQFSAIKKLQVLFPLRLDFLRFGKCIFLTRVVAGKFLENQEKFNGESLQYVDSKKSPTGPTERTPKPENLIALATSLGVRW